ncbi:hypothetical protein DBT_0411 [Dissulfuribacter thermophilus]|uniref:Uncharacterized protein n=1 Tax=Dissulfuribacter thermophilus TaxID=1156395 RepID=A0A1B9F7N3_9BACT|nr:hypothetical protein [Dissulfuribacter thermophilus]OCC15949.1 hypothetical protein DBT_0411 [Dissulfuribacter thermophilus]
MPWIVQNLKDILCEQHERTVNNDNCVQFKGLTLQIPQTPYRCHYVKAKVWIHSYPDGSLAIFHGPRKSAAYNPDGSLIEEKKECVAP